MKEYEVQFNIAYEGHIIDAWRGLNFLLGTILEEEVNNLQIKPKYNKEMMNHEGY